MNNIKTGAAGMAAIFILQSFRLSHYMKQYSY